MDVLEVALVTRKSGWTVLARVAPGASHGGTTQLLGADNTCQLALTHVVDHSLETWSRPVVCNIVQSISNRQLITKSPEVWKSGLVKKGDGEREYCPISELRLSEVQPCLNHSVGMGFNPVVSHCQQKTVQSWCFPSKVNLGTPDDILAIQTPTTVDS